jgi:transposase-like protein
MSRTLTYMNTEQQPPRTLMEAMRYFADADVCIEYVAKLRWPNGPVCPTCDGTEHSFLKTRRLWKCKACKRQFSVKVGSIFEDSAIPLDKWLGAIWLIANSKNGISSHELGRSIGLTQKSAWFVLHRIRLAMQTGSFDRFDGDVEVDESYIGGKARNMHKVVKKQRGIGHGAVGKTAVAGMVQRGRDGQPSQVRASVLESANKVTLHRMVRENIEPGATVHTDSLTAYRGLDEYDHRTIDHLVTYVDGNVTTNAIENFWSLLKRGLHGTYVSVQPFHLFRYVDERAFSFNYRDMTDLGRFTLVLNRVAGRRLTYAELTGKA